MSFLTDLKLVLEVIWGSFFAWMPVPLLVVFGAIVAVSLMIMVLRIVAMVLDAIPFV